MAYDEKLAARLETAARDWPGLEPKKMFGNVGWLLGGNMCVGTWHDSLIVRCSPDDWPRLLAQKGVAEFDVTGRSMKGWLTIKPEAVAADADLRKWLRIAVDFVGTLPSKSKSSAPKPARRGANAKKRRA